MNKARLSAVSFIRNSWSKSFNKGIVYSRVGLKRICAIISRQYTELFYKPFTRATESGRPMVDCNFGNILPFTVPKCHGGKIYVFWHKTFKVVRILLYESWSLPFHNGCCWCQTTLIQERHNHRENCITVKVSRRTQKVEIYLANERSVPAFFSTDLGHILRSNAGNEFGVILSGKGPHKPEIAHDIVRLHSLKIHTDLIEYNIVGNTRAPLLRCFRFIPKLKGRDIITIGQYKNYQTFRNL